MIGLLKDMHLGTKQEQPEASRAGSVGVLAGPLRHLAPVALAFACLAILIPAKYRPLVSDFFRQHPPWSWPRPGGGALLLLAAGAFLFLVLWSRFERAGRVLMLLGLTVFSVKAVLIAPSQYIGHADPSCYAEMARSLCERRGLEVDYVSYYYHPLAPGIARPEDHWPPFYAFATVPFFLTLGVTAFAAKLASLLISCLLLPCAGYALARRIAGAPGAGFAAGLNLLLLPEMFEPSLWPNSDGAFTFLIVLTAWLFMRGIEKPRSFLWMGVAGALCNYAKGIGILLVPVFGLFGLWYAVVRKPVVLDEPALCLSGWRRAALCLAVLLVPLAFAPPEVLLFFLPCAGGLYLLGRWYERAGAWPLPPHRRAIWRNLIAGFVIWGLVLLPMCLRNTWYFGAPFYSTQQHAAGFQSAMKYETGAFPLYWGRNLPAIANLLSDPPALIQTAGRNLATSARNLLESASRKSWTRMRMESRGREGWWPRRPYDEAILAWSSPSWPGLGIWLPALSAWTGLLLAAAAVVYRLLAGLARVAARASPMRDRQPGRLRLAAGRLDAILNMLLAPWFDARILVVAAPAAIVVVFISALWAPIPRYLFPARALIMVLGSVALFHILRLPAAALAGIAGRVVRGHTFSASRVASAAIAAITLLLAARPKRQLWDTQVSYLDTDREKGTGMVILGRWIHDNLPNAIVMTRNPWELHFHSNRPAVQIPLAPIEETLGVAKYFGVTHIIPDGRRRPALDPLVTGRVPGLTKVQTAPSRKLYRLDFTALPPALQHPPAPGTGRPPMITAEPGDHEPDGSDSATDPDEL